MKNLHRFTSTQKDHIQSNLSMRSLTSYKKLISYEIFYDRTKKGDLLIQVISWTGLTVCGLFEWK
jgi:hypothetical protein